MSEYALLLPFDVDDPEFARGFEAGRLWTILNLCSNVYLERMSAVGCSHVFDIHATNAEMVLRICEATDHRVNSEDLDDTWIRITPRSGQVWGDPDNPPDSEGEESP